MTDCEHKWTLDDAAAQHDSATQLWYGCTECSAKRYVLLDATRNNEWLRYVVTTDKIEGEITHPADDKPHTTVADHPFMNYPNRKFCETHDCMQITEVDGEPFMDAVDNVCLKCMGEEE